MSIGIFLALGSAKPSDANPACLSNMRVDGDATSLIEGTGLLAVAEKRGWLRKGTTVVLHRIFGEANPGGLMLFESLLRHPVAIRRNLARTVPIVDAWLHERGCRVIHYVGTPRRGKRYSADEFFAAISPLLHCAGDICIDAIASMPHDNHNAAHIEALARWLAANGRMLWIESAADRDNTWLHNFPSIVAEQTYHTHMNDSYRPGIGARLAMPDDNTWSRRDIGVVHGGEARMAVDCRRNGHIALLREAPFARDHDEFMREAEAVKLTDTPYWRHKNDTTGGSGG